MGGVVGISMVKDEVDILEETLIAMAGEVDALLVADNGSTDGTRQLLERLAQDLPLQVIDDPEVGYHQARKMTALAARAGQAGAAWVIAFDADERWTSPHGPIADVLANQPAASIATARLFDHVATGQDPPAGGVLERLGWRRQHPAPLPKIAARPYPSLRIYQGNHAADHGTTVDGLLEVRHFPYRTPDQLVRKVRNGAAAYAATDLPDHEGAHWRQYGQLLEARGEQALHDVFRRWFWTAHPEREPSLVYDPAPPAR